MYLWFRRWLDGLRYNRSERNGLMLFVFLSAGFSGFILWNPSYYKIDRTQDERFLDVVSAHVDSIRQFLLNEQKQSLFLFDPNRIDSLLLDSLKLQDEVILKWMKYLKSGQKFYRPMDVLRIDGIDSNWLAEAQNYMVFPTKRVFSSQEQTEIPERKVEWFNFQADTMKVADWQKLGMSPKQAKSVHKYFSKLKRRTQTKDLDKIYVLDRALIDRLKSLMVENTSQGSHDVGEELNLTESPIQINVINIEELIKRTDWPPTLCKRVIEYRNKLGGYHELEQLTEVYGLELQQLDSFWGLWDFKSGGLTKLFINKLNMAQLATHPYIDFRLARAIVDFRESVRPIKSLKDLHEMSLISPEIIAKLAPYLSFEI